MDVNITGIRTSDDLEVNVSGINTSSSLNVNVNLDKIAGSSAYGGLPVKVIK
jgi:TATA-box binding protein (TBP) (component of TFIID and TFIIIB)